MSVSMLTLAKALCESLRQHPEEWKFTQYQAIHTSKTAIWLANGFGALSVTEDLDHDDAKLGGINTFTALFGWLVPWRVVLGMAFLNERRRRLAGQKAAQRQRTSTRADRILAAINVSNSN